MKFRCTFRIPGLAIFSFVLWLLLGLQGCIPISTPLPSLTSTPADTPTLTLLPSALVVNGEAISQAEFNSELIRYQQARTEKGLELDLEADSQVVRDYFIDMLLLAQGAATLGYVVDDETLQARLDSLIVDLGGEEALAAWMAANGYEPTGLRLDLQRQIAAAWMRDQILTSVPATADQVHVRQILFYNEEDARNVETLLLAGWDFDTLARQYDPTTGGELGWFPLGYLVHPAIEAAAFSLLPGENSTVVESSVGFHILHLVERDPAHPLSPDALLTLQQKAFQYWLTQRRNESTIVVAP